jgi:hypothetical protein
MALSGISDKVRRICETVLAVIGALMGAFIVLHLLGSFVSRHYCKVAFGSFFSFTKRQVES